jgi:hypothetical protein
VAAGLTYIRHASSSAWTMAGRRVAVGQTIETGANLGTTLQAAAFGTLELEPQSRLQLLTSGAGNQQFALQRGTIHALIWAPPTRFVVETPSAKTVDLGCAYTLTVLGDGSGLLTVETGWVAFQTRTRESFIPAGAACRTRPSLGPGLPYFVSSSSAFREAIVLFDRTGGKEGLETILEEAETKDGLTLWHLLTRTSGRDRELVAHKFASLVPGVDAPRLEAGNAAAIDQAWNLLDLGRTEWWRMWKHDWQ